MASKLSDKVMGVLSVNQKAGNLQVAAVKTPGMRLDDQMNALEDLAVLTGGKCFYRAAGDTLEQVTPESFGQARKIWADMNYTGLVGGKNDPILRRHHIDKLSHAYHLADEAEIRTKLRDRVGRLYSGAAVIWMGGMTESEITLRKELAQRTSDTIRSAIYGGVVTGGGVSFLACQPALRAKLAATSDPDAQAAYRILLTALETPFRTILANAGYSSGAIMSQVEQAGLGLRLRCADRAGCRSFAIGNFRCRRRPKRSRLQRHPERSHGIDHRCRHPPQKTPRGNRSGLTI